MEIQQLLKWSFPLRLQPDILAANSGPVGVHRVERYEPLPYWQIGFFDGAISVELTVNTRTWNLDIKPQDIFVIPANSLRVYHADSQVNHYYMAFRFPEVSASQQVVELSALIHPGPSAGMIRQDMVTIADLRNSERFESDLLAWLLLWRLTRISRRTSRAQQDAATAVQATLLRIRENIADPSLTPESLADAAGFSRRRLDQLFVQEVGSPVSASIQDRRKQLALELLRNSSLPVQDIGVQVGIRDPHGFNKFIRRNCGKSPTGIRKDDSGRVM